jgi:hypothetical protein
MFNDRPSFSNYRAHNDHCHFADADISVPVVGEGTVTVINDEGRPIQLLNALHVPSFSSSLISVSKAGSKGGYFEGGDDQMQVTDKAGVVLVRGTLSHSL